MEKCSAKEDLMTMKQLLSTVNTVISSVTLGQFMIFLGGQKAQVEKEAREFYL